MTNGDSISRILYGLTKSVSVLSHTVQVLVLQFSIILLNCLNDICDYTVQLYIYHNYGDNRFIYISLSPLSSRLTALLYHILIPLFKFCRNEQLNQPAEINVMISDSLACVANQ